jgi:hypothetical protein
MSMRGLLARSRLYVGLTLIFPLAGCGADLESDPPPALPTPPSAPPPGEVPPAQTAQSAVPDAPQAPPPQSQPQSTQPPPAAALPAQYAAAPSADQPPPQAQWVTSYPQGQWVYASGYGWMWVPAGAVTTEMDGVPYVYLYTRPYGWTWYVSPWGWGPYHYGIWVRHPWYPRGWRAGWVARPHVVVRLGGRGHYRR